MPPRKPAKGPNPAAGKEPAEEIRYRAHTRNVNGKRVAVRSHTRQAQITRTKEVWIGAGFSTLAAGAIVVEAGVTIVMSLGMVAIMAFSWLALVSGRRAASNRARLFKLLGLSKWAARGRRKPPGPKRAAPRAAGPKAAGQAGAPRAKSTKAKPRPKPKPRAKPAAPSQPRPKPKPSAGGSSTGRSSGSGGHHGPTIRPGTYTLSDGTRVKIVKCPPCTNTIDPECSHCGGKGVIAFDRQ